MGPYTLYLIEKVMPRISLEMKLLTQTQKTMDGDWLQVAEDISSGDLFHAHVRIPIKEYSLKNGEISKTLFDPEQYHIQYHSFETFSEYVDSWKMGLRQIPHAALHNWLKKLDEYESEQNRISRSGVNEAAGDIAMNKVTLEKLTEHQIDQFAKAWFDTFMIDTEVEADQVSWLLSRCREKLRLIDPLTYSGDGSVTGYRSVVSTPDSFKVIKSINLAGYVQPANFYIAKRSQRV